MKGDSTCHIFSDEGRRRFDRMKWNSRPHPQDWEKTAHTAGVEDPPTPPTEPPESAYEPENGGFWP